MFGRLGRYVRRFGWAGFGIYLAMKRGRGVVGVRVPGLGGPIFLRPRTTDRGVFNQVFVEDAFSVEPLRSPRLIIDAGANIGLTTLWLARRWPDADVIAVEPDAENFALLERNVAHLPRVRAVRAALWIREERLALENPGDAPDAYRVRAARPGEPAFEAVTVAGLLSGSGHADLDVLKIDIEGAERDVFADPGSRAWLARTHTIAIELHDRFKPGCAAAVDAAVAGLAFRRSQVGEKLVLVRE
jgi:FkbM family methyltransferase